MDSSTSRPSKKRPAFFIENLLADEISGMDPPPPAKRPRFFIENLLGLGDPSVQIREKSPEKQNKPDEYVKKLESNVQRNQKFQMLNLKTRFSINNVPADPEGLLLGIFQYCIDEAIEECRQSGLEADQVGVTISSELLDLGDVWTPVRPLNENMAEALLNLFMKVSQSKKQQGITLWGEPFTITVTTVNVSGLPTRKQLKGGSQRRKILAPVHHSINEASLIRIPSNAANNYCLFMALQASMVQQTYKMSKRDFYDYINDRNRYRGIFRRDINELMKKTGAPFNQTNYDAEFYVPRIIDYWNDKMKPNRFRVFIFGSTGHYKPMYKYGNDDYNIALILYHNNEHFDGLRIGGRLFGKPYCLECETTYDRDATHSKTCRRRCLNCTRVGANFPCKKTQNYCEECQNCQKKFVNKDCYNYHIQSKLCNREKCCKECGIIYNTEVNKRNGRTGHHCQERWCGRCDDFKPIVHNCYIQPMEPVDEKPIRYIAFDLETMQHQNLENSTTKRWHEPNFVSVKVACPKCISSGHWNLSQKDKKSCTICGPHRTVAFSQRPFKNTFVDYQKVSNEPVKDFVKWLLYELSDQFKTIAFSHFGGRFDMILVFRELYLAGINPTMIRKGNRMYEMVAKRKFGKNRGGGNADIVFRDFFNLVPTSLAALVPTFGLDVEENPYFPHLANQPKNYGKLITPTKEDYLADGMLPEKRKAFDLWYEKHGNEPFLLDEALASYGMNDVEILMAALIAFRNEFFELSKRMPDPKNGNRVNRAASDKPHQGIDALRSMTIASLCMRHYRTNHLKAEHLGIVPERGYDTADNQSRVAMQFFQWYSEKYGVILQTANSIGGEKRVPNSNYRLDAWIEAEQRGIEFHGCSFHGCKKCYPEDDLVMPNGKTAGKLRELEKKRMEFILTQLPRVDIYWECEVKNMLAKDMEMRQKFELYRDEGPMDLRNQFFMGGRTGPLKLYHKAKEGEMIKYLDINSLYPYICAVTEYPVGHPIVHIKNEDVNWKSSADNPYRLALIKCFVVPPRKVDVPVLPVKVDDKLIFPLCVTCTKNHPIGGFKPNYSCIHNDEQRGFVCSTTSLELNAALDEGYTVRKIYRVLEYTKSDKNVFKPFIAEFMAEKIQSSGFDEEIRGNKEAEQKFVKECAELFDITIDSEKMVPNKGRRALSKLCLNNLWGRFSLRNYGLSQTRITDDPSELRSLLTNRSIEVSSIDELTPSTVLISYVQKKDWVEENASSNVVISLWTTSAARLYLLKAMQKIVRTPGCTLLYTDTDSVLFVMRNRFNPLETGPHLGQFKDEFPHHMILEYCSGGAKQYALKLKDQKSSSIDYVLKLRGITLNYDVTKRQNLHYETFKEKVIKFATTGKIEPIHLLYPNFLKPSIQKAHVTTQPLNKLYRPFVGKGIVGPNFQVLDFGYIRS